MENAFWLLLGSVITIGITNLFDIFKLSKANKFDLQKIYFEKKMSAAEEAITDLFEEMSGVREFIRIYEKITLTDIEKVPYVIEQLDIFTKGTTKALEETDKIAKRMYLYFDFEDYLDKEQLNLDALLNISTEIRKIDSEMKVSADLLKEYKEDKVASDILFAQMKEKFQEYIPKLKELVELGTKAQTEAKNQFKQIKLELKKYDL